MVTDHREKLQFSKGDVRMYHEVGSSLGKEGRKGAPLCTE